VQQICKYVCTFFCYVIETELKHVKLVDKTLEAYDLHEGTWELQFP